MAIPTQLELHNWKLFSSQRLDLDFIEVQNSCGLILYGANGSGKTSILEAYYSLLTSKPWPRTKFNQSLHFGANYFGVGALGNQWFFNGQINPRGRVITKWEKPENLVDRPAVFWYQPNFNYWLGLSRGDKLKILDMLIMMSGDSNYSHSLAKLNQAIKGKQNLIKQAEINPDIDTIILNHLNADIFDASLRVWSGRRKFFDKIIERIEQYGNMIETNIANFGVRCQYSNILGRRSIIDSDLPGVPTTEQWTNIWSKEVITGQVLYGAHRDDFDFEINKQPIDSIFSRGERRLFTFFVIALAIDSHRQTNPNRQIALLADDIFNELDTKRNRLLFDKIVDNVDYFLITSAQSVIGLEDYSKNIEEVLI